MDYKIIVTVDTNDSDYNSVINDISEEKLKIIEPIIEALKGFEPYNAEGYLHYANYPYDIRIRPEYGEKTLQELYNIDSDILSTFEQFVPHLEEGFHSVESIVIYPKDKEIKLF